MLKRVRKRNILFKICLFFTFVSPILGGNSRKYDIETEAMKLYGEDFKSVLRRFRRTPDYLKILNDKMAELKIYFNEMSLQVLHYYHLKMAQKVGDMVGVTRSFPEEATAPTKVPVYYHSNNRRQDDEDEEEKTESPEPEINAAAIKELDNYKAFNYELTVAERNSFRDLGFEFAGSLIHTIMQNMGPEEPVIKSTRLPGGGDDHKAAQSTQHPAKHEVTESADTNKDHNDAHTSTVSSTDTFRFSDGNVLQLALYGDADFYPNGGSGMPGCNSMDCDHKRSFHYMAETFTTGGFTGKRCASYLTAITGNCFLLGNLKMGGLVPKTGQSGIFYLETNAAPPFSKG